MACTGAPLGALKSTPSCREEQPEQGDDRGPNELAILVPAGTGQRNPAVCAAGALRTDVGGGTGRGFGLAVTV
jgi:hypothetical protein